MKKIFLSICWMLPLTVVTGQIVDKGGIQAFTLSQGLNVMVMPGYDVYGAHTYYYLPTNLRLATRIDKTPEFSFLNYATTTGDKDVSGAILHFLLTWGLTPDQEKELEYQLKSKVDSLAMVGGAVNVDLPTTAHSFSISGKSDLAEILRTRFSQEPVAPVIPGTKMALSYRLNDKEAKEVQSALDDPRKLESVMVELSFQFHGGYQNLWLNQFKTNTYVLSTKLSDLLAPILKNKPDADK